MRLMGRGALADEKAAIGAWKVGWQMAVVCGMLKAGILGESGWNSVGESRMLACILRI